MYKEIRSSFGAVLVTASLVSAEVSVNFINSTLAPNTTNHLDMLILWFSVDKTGNVTMDASSSSGEQIVRDAVDAWDGPVGTVSYSKVFNTTFLLEVNGVGGSGLKLTNHGGGGLGVGGQSAWRIDSPGFEFIDVMASLNTGKVCFRSVKWNYRAAEAPVSMTLTGPLGSLTNNCPSLAGTWDLSGRELMIANNEILRFSNVFPGNPISGYALAGFSFDIIDGSLSTPLTVGSAPDSAVSERRPLCRKTADAIRF